MANDIIEINLNDLDDEIKELENRIANLQAIIRDKKLIRRYLELRKKGIYQLPPEEMSFEKYPIGISAFILNFLEKNDDRSAAEIIAAYAKFQGKTEKEVQNNVSNALWRLKEAKKIRR